MRHGLRTSSSPAPAPAPASTHRLVFFFIFISRPFSFFVLVQCLLGIEAGTSAWVHHHLIQSGPPLSVHVRKFVTLCDKRGKATLWQRSSQNVSGSSGCELRRPSPRFPTVGVPQQTCGTNNPMATAHARFKCCTVDFARVTALNIISDLFLFYNL